MPMTRRETAKPVLPTIGEAVGFAPAFIDRHGRHTPAMEQACGVVRAVHELDHIKVVDVDWDRPGLPRRLDVKNLIVQVMGPCGR